MKLSRKDVDINEEHIGHTIRFVEICDGPDDLWGVVCAVCCTCGDPATDQFKILAIVEDKDAIEQIKAETGEIRRAMIDWGGMM
jgi:hypothetical protein